MSLELKNYSILVFNMFRNAVITFPEINQMHLVLQSTVLAKSKEEELIGYIEKVFCERSGFSLRVETEYQEAKESKYRKNSDIRILQEAEHIIEMSALGRGKEEEIPVQEEPVKKEEKKQTVSGKKKAEEKSFKTEKGKAKNDRNFSSDFKRSVKRSDNPDVLYGRDFEDEAIPLESIQSEMGEVCIRGQIMTLEKREIRNEKTIIIFSITDFTDSITVKMFARNDQVAEITEGVKEKAFVKLKGVTTIDRYDSELTIGSVVGIKKISEFRNTRFDNAPEKRVELHCHTKMSDMDGVSDASELTIGSVVGIKKISEFRNTRFDNAPEKRVELHCHTKMSDMDGVSDAKALIKRAYEWGHKASEFRNTRFDNAPEKRVELHCHTKMSDMDGVSDAKALIKRAYEWGHKAIAITDHGVAQSFPEANHCFDAWGGVVPQDADFKVIYGVEAYLVDDLKQSFPEANHCFDAWGGVVPQDADFKVIYGVEAYLVDDLKGIVQNSKGQSLHDAFVVFDIETTGFSAMKDKIIEIGAVKVVDGKITERFSEFVNPQIPIPFRIEQLTSINDNMVKDAPTIDVILPQFEEFCRGCVMVAHNAEFDMSFIQKNYADIGIQREDTIVDTVGMARFLLPQLCRGCVMVAHNAEFDMSFIQKNYADIGIQREDTIVDTVGMARFLLPQLNRFKLDTVAKAVGVSLEHHHRAVDDAACTAEIFEKFIPMCEERDIMDLDDLNKKGAVSVESVQKMPTYHAIILAKNDVGRVNLYHLISDSHLIYYHRRPRIPKSLYLKYQEGLMIGSACEAGELYQAILNGRPEAEIARLVNFYDYLEVQPLGNNAFMIRNEDRSDINSEEDLQEINRKIIKLGEAFNKPVVATCDVHFLDPEDEVYRRIIMAGKGFDDADEL